jgi:hypothetical protein
MPPNENVDEENVARRPITVWVAEVSEQIPSMDHLHKIPSRIVHIELTKADARKLRDVLEKRLNDGVHGSIRIAMTGRLVI